MEIVYWRFVTHREGVQGRVEGRPWEVTCGGEGEGRRTKGRRGLKQGGAIQLVAKLKSGMFGSRGEVVGSSFGIAWVRGGADGVGGGAHRGMWGGPGGASQEWCPGGEEGMKRIDNMLFNLLKGSREGKGGDNADKKAAALRQSQEQLETIEVASVINRKGLARAGSWFMTEG